MSTVFTVVSILEFFSTYSILTIVKIEVLTENFNDLIFEISVHE